MKIITQRQIESIKDKIGSRRFYYILSNTVDALRENELKSVIVEEQRGFYLIVGQFQSYRQFQCSVALHKDGTMAKYYCHCYNSYDVICEHSLALLLCAATNDIQKFPAQLDAQFIFSAVKKLVKSIPQYYCNMNPFYNLFLTQEDMEFYETIAQSETFMQKQDSFLNRLFAPISKEKVHLEVSSSTNEDGKEYFRLKIGNHKMYVVKNVSQFLEAFFDEKTISYGKDLTFSHSIDYLDDESLELLNLLKAGIFFKDHTMRDFAFGGASLDRFFQLCKSFDETHCTFRCVQERGFFALNIRKEADYYRVSIHHQDSNLSNVQVTPKAIYQSNQNVLTQKFFDEHGVVVSFIKQLLHQDLLLDQQNFQKFYALMIEPYKPYLQLNIEGFDLNQSIDESITLYVDLNDSYLVEYRIGYELNGMHLPLSEALKQS